MTRDEVIADIRMTVERRLADRKSLRASPKTDRILDLWSKTDLDMDLIAERLSMSRGGVGATIARARAAGDPRAIRKPRASR